MSIRAGTYRTVRIDDRTADVVEVNDIFTQLRQVIRVSLQGDAMYCTENLAVMLAMCLNAGVDTMALNRALAAYVGQDEFA